MLSFRHMINRRKSASLGAESAWDDDAFVPGGMFLSGRGWTAALRVGCVRKLLLTLREGVLPGGFTPAWSKHLLLRC